MIDQLIDLGGWVIPEGWELETTNGLPNCVVIGSKNLGWVTVDMKARIYSPGIGSPRTWSAVKSIGFTGRGWQRRIMDAAEYYLRSINAK